MAAQLERNTVRIRINARSERVGIETELSPDDDRSSTRGFQWFQWFPPESRVKSQRAWAASAVVTRMCGALKGLDRGLKFVRQHAASAITRHSPTVNCLHAELVVLLAVINVRRGKGEGEKQACAATWPQSHRS